jgi:hypothetical protein
VRLCGFAGLDRFIYGWRGSRDDHNEARRIEQPPRRPAHIVQSQPIDQAITTRDIFDRQAFALKTVELSGNTGIGRES